MLQKYRVVLHQNGSVIPHELEVSEKGKPLPENIPQTAGDEIVDNPDDLLRAIERVEFLIRERQGQKEAPGADNSLD